MKRAENRRVRIWSINNRVGIVCVWIVSWLLESRCYLRLVINFLCRCLVSCRCFVPRGRDEHHISSMHVDMSACRHVAQGPRGQHVIRNHSQLFPFLNCNSSLLFRLEGYSFAALWWWKLYNDGILGSVYGSVTICYIYVYGMFMSLLAKTLVGLDIPYST